MVCEGTVLAQQLLRELSTSLPKELRALARQNI